MNWIKMNRIKLNSKWLVSTLVVGCVALSGCGSAHNQTATTGDPSGAANAAGSNAIGSNAIGSNATGAGGGAGGNNTTSAGVGNAASQSGTASAGTNTADGTGTTATAAAQLVRQTMALAKQGKVSGIPFVQQSNMSAVNQAWGKPDSQNMAGAGMYASYGARNVAFGFNKGEQIFDLRSYSALFQTVAFADIQSALGNPGAVRQTSDSYIYMYPAGADYQLLWVFPKLSDGSRGVHVNHVSVFWPQGTVDLMAQNAPAPKVVINGKPGRLGSLFTFSIENAPKDYSLAELEWIPDKGTAVVDTTSQAMDNGQTGAQNPGFGISGDGQTLRFVYPSSLKGQSGKVRVIYQNASGGALLGEGDSVTLK